MPASAAYLPSLPSPCTPVVRCIDITAIAGPFEPVIYRAIPEMVGKNKAPHPATPYGPAWCSALFTSANYKPPSPSSAVWADLVDDSHATTVLCPGCLIRAEDSRTLLAIADGGDAVSIDATSQQVVLHRIGATLGQREVVLTRAALVGMTFNGHGDARILVQPRSLTVQGCPGLRSQVELVKTEEHAIADVDDQIF